MLQKNKTNNMQTNSLADLRAFSTSFCGAVAKVGMTFCLLLFAVVATAQEISVNAPRQAVMGTTFMLRYTVSNADVEDITLGEHDGLNCLAGPYTSRSSSVQIINGRTSQSSSITLTYTMSPASTGKHTIEGATITIDGKKCKTRAVTVEVLPGDDNSGGRGGNGGNGGYSNGGGNSGYGSGGQGGGTTAPKGDGKDLFVTVSASKTRVYEQEAVLLTYKIYTLLSLNAVNDDSPEFKGCHQQEIELPQQKSPKLEHYNGRNYQTFIWRQFLLFPQQAGKLTIPSVKYECYGQTVDHSADPLDLFFGGGSMVREFKRNVQTPKLEITVNPLPTPKPANFSGAVGQFTLSSSLTPQELKTNDALTLRLIVSGTGNMKLIKAPKVAFPTDFETYDPKVDDKTRVSAQGVSGNKVFDYVAVPRHSGSFDVPQVEFCYFDPAAAQYKTLTSDAFTVQVEKGSGSAGGTYVPSQQEELDVLAEDIRFIKRGETNPISGNGSLFASSLYWGVYAGAIALFVLLVIIFRRKIKENADIAKQRGRKAGKAANKRLKRARKLMGNHAPAEFYDEILKTLWGFVADKLNIDVAELNRDNVAAQMLEKGVGQNLIDQFLTIVSDCEFARYAPGDPNENMDKIYTQAEHLIENIRL